jgi:hypothetical protein
MKLMPVTLFRLRARSLLWSMGRCGLCGEAGHNRRTCKKREDAGAEEQPAASPQAPSPEPEPEPEAKGAGRWPAELPKDRRRWPRQLEDAPESVVRGWCRALDLVSPDASGPILTPAELIAMLRHTSNTLRCTLPGKDKIFAARGGIDLYTRLNADRVVQLSPQSDHVLEIQARQ